MILITVSASVNAADDIRVIANVESRDVYVGESFLMQIAVDGSDKVEIPDMTAIDGFAIRYTAGLATCRQPYQTGHEHWKHHRGVKTIR